MVTKFPRSVSAYENTLCEIEESDDDSEADDVIQHFFPPTTSSESGDVDEEEEDEKSVEIPVKTEVFEIALPKDVDQPNGMAFRMVGSRSRGVFIDYIHPDSPQAILLREGDLLLRCNKISLRAITVDQAASIFRFWMSRTSSLILQVERRDDGESVMMRRRRQAKLSMCAEQREQTRGYCGRATLRMTSSKSAEVFRSQFERKSVEFHTFDTATKHLCPHCNSHTRLLYLHQFSHGFVHNAFRFLTSSRSSYSLL